MNDKVSSQLIHIFQLTKGELLGGTKKDGASKYDSFPKSNRALRSMHTPNNCISSVCCIEKGSLDTEPELEYCSFDLYLSRLNNIFDALNNQSR